MRKNTALHESAPASDFKMNIFITSDKWFPGWISRNLQRILQSNLGLNQCRLNQFQTKSSSQRDKICIDSGLWIILWRGINVHKKSMLQPQLYQSSKRDSDYFFYDLVSLGLKLRSLYILAFNIYIYYIYLAVILFMFMIYSILFFVFDQMS